MAALTLGASAEGYKIEKVWTLNAPSIFTTTNDVRQGFGMNGKFYIHNKADQLVYEIDENGLTGVTFEGGTNCGISRDEAGNIIVSNAGFGSTAWIEATFKVINPQTGEVNLYTVPEESGLTGRCDFFGFAKGNLLEDGELYLTAGTPDNSIFTDGIARILITGGEVDINNCYLATCDGLNTNTSTVINYYSDINGEDALLFAYRSGHPGKLLANGDDFTRKALVLPNKGSCNGVYPIVWDGKELYIYPTLPNYFDGWAVSEAGTVDEPATPIVTVPATVSANPNGIQCNWLNAEADADGITIYQYVPGGQISVYRLTKEESTATNVYILGEVNDKGWAANDGVLMDYDAENNVYTATVTLDGRGESGENYFSFTTELANDNDDGGWAYIQPFRFGAVSEGDFWFSNNMSGWPLGLTYENAQAFRVMGGEYKLTLSLENMKLTIENLSVSHLRGDVNNSGDVKIDDVTALIDYLLSGNDSNIIWINADCNMSGDIKIDDVTSLIDFLLSGAWNN